MSGRLFAVLGAVLAIGVMVGSTSASSQPGAAISSIRSTSTSSYCADSQEQALLKLINDYRKQNGVAALTLSQALGAAADHHSRSMANNNYVSHDLIPEGITWSKNLQNHGYSYTTYRGENIAAGNSSASATFAQWKASSTHNANMLNKSARRMGIATAYAPNSKYKVYWVLAVAADRRSAPAEMRGRARFGT